MHPVYGMLLGWSLLPHISPYEMQHESGTTRFKFDRSNACSAPLLFLLLLFDFSQTLYLQSSNRSAPQHLNWNSFRKILLYFYQLPKAKVYFQMYRYLEIWNRVVVTHILLHQIDRICASLIDAVAGGKCGIERYHKLIIDLRLVHIRDSADQKLHGKHQYQQHRILHAIK